MDTESFSFVVEWYDALADLVKEFNLSVYKPQHGPLEASMYDPKGKRSFLKRTPVPDLRLEDLHVGGTVTVYARQLKVKAYGDARTNAVLDSKRGSFAILTSPSAYHELGRVVSAFESVGLTIGRLRLVNDGGPVVALEVLGEDAEAKWLKASGSLPAGAVTQVPRENAVAYFDKAKYPTTAAFDNCTLCIIRPHALKAGNAGEIITAVLQGGFELSAAQTVQLQRAEALELFEVYKGVLPYFTELVDTMSAAPCLAMELRGEAGVVERFRELCGPYDVDMAKHLRPQSLRARFGIDNAQNGVHASDLEDDAEMEVRYVFDLLP